MVAEKLSISLDAALAATVREAAAEEGVSLSTWIAEAARARARQAALHAVVCEHAAAHGAFAVGEAERLVAEARKRSVVTGRRAKK